MSRNARTNLPPSTAPGEPDEPKNLTKQEFGRRLQAVLMDRNLNQSDLARAAGLGRDAVSTYVRGRSFPEPKNLAKIAQALGVSTQALLPNTIASALDQEAPSMEIKEAVGHEGKCWVRINRLVTTKQALKIMQILNED